MTDGCGALLTLRRDFERRERPIQQPSNERFCGLCLEQDPFSKNLGSEFHDKHLSTAHQTPTTPADPARSQRQLLRGIQLPGTCAYGGLSWPCSPQDPIFTKLRAKSQHPAAADAISLPTQAYDIRPRWPPSRMAQPLREFSMIAMWRRKPWSPTTRSRSSMRMEPNSPRSTP